MAATGRAVAASSLGAWLLKASPAGLDVDEMVRARFRTLTTRCVRHSYRADLVAAGQPVLLWVSGNDRRHPPGIYARGLTTGPVEYDVPEPQMPVRLVLLEPTISRVEVLAEPGLAGIEVLRMPAGSNPSYLDVGQYDVLRAAFPQLGGTAETIASTLPGACGEPDRHHLG